MGGPAGAGTPFVLRGGRVVRQLAVVLVVSLAGLAVPALAQAVSITQLPNKAPAAFNALDEVLADDGYLWVNSTTVLGPPQPPASDPNATFKPTLVGGGTELLNDSGVVVGTVTTGTGATVPGYWDSAHSNAFTEISLAGLPAICNSPVVGGELLGVDASGEAVGMVTANVGGGCAGGGEAALYVPAVGGLPAGQPQVIQSVGGVGISSLYGISTGFEAGIEGPAGGAGGYSGEPLLVDRARQTATPTSFGAGVQPWSPNGNMAGATTGGDGAIFLRSADGSQTQLSGGGSVVAVNNAGFAVGDVDCSSSVLGDCTPVEWSPTGAVVTLQSELPAGSGWTLTSVASINAQGDIVGQGDIAGHQEDFLLTGNDNSSTALACPETADGTFSCTATVSAAASGGVAPTGEVDWSATAGALSASACTLAAISASASACSVELTPTQIANENAQTVTADYTGGNNFEDSNATATIPALMLSATPPATVDTYLDGSADAKFRFTLSRASNTPVTVDYATQDGTGADAAKAAAGDYKPVKGTLTFAPGKTTATVKVKCNADIKLRHTSDFDLNLSNLTGASLTSTSANLAAAHAGAHSPSATAPRTLTIQVKIKPDLRVGRVHEIRNIRTDKEGVLYVERYDTHKISRLKEGDWVYVGDRIGASRSTATVITFELGGAVAVQPGSLIRIVDYNRSLTEIPGSEGPLYRLRQRFQVWSDVSHQKETMQVQTNAGVMGIKG
jgi:hypothetical protein